VYTGFPTNAGTTANVYIQLSGDEDQTEVRQLKDENRRLFQTRGEDIFLASYPKYIGDLQYVRIWHDNCGMLYFIFFFSVIERFFFQFLFGLRRHKKIRRYRILNENHLRCTVGKRIHSFLPYEMYKVIGIITSNSNIGY